MKTRAKKLLKDLKKDKFLQPGYEMAYKLLEKIMNNRTSSFEIQKMSCGKFFVQRTLLHFYGKIFEYHVSISYHKIKGTENYAEEEQIKVTRDGEHCEKVEAAIENFLANVLYKHSEF